MTNITFGDFVGLVNKYLESEYDPNEFVNLNMDEKWAIRSMIEVEYYSNHCVSNVTQQIVGYLRDNRNIIN